MEIQQYIVDAFTDQQFGGNPAAICILKEAIPEKVMQKIAFENAQPETAFVLPNPDGDFKIQWFTPRIEMDLCGHATLATAHVFWHHLKYSESKIPLHSKSGLVEILRKNGRYILNFPARMPELSSLPDTIRESLNIQPQQVLKSRDYVLIYENEDQIKNLTPDEAILDAINIDPGGIIVTAPGKEVDFVSRFFTPQDRRFEDPVTGSAHCSLIPYWAKQLNKKRLKAYQLSDRHGTLFCEDHDDRVHIGGTARTFSQGTVYLDL